MDVLSIQDCSPDLGWKQISAVDSMHIQWSHGVMHENGSMEGLSVEAIGKVTGHEVP
jgi:hypothetical protein